MEKCAPFVNSSTLRTPCFYVNLKTATLNVTFSPPVSACPSCCIDVYEEALLPPTKTLSRTPRFSGKSFVIRRTDIFFFKVLIHANDERRRETVGRTCLEGACDAVIRLQDSVHFAPKGNQSSASIPRHKVDP